MKLVTLEPIFVTEIWRKFQIHIWLAAYLFTPKGIFLLSSDISKAFVHLANLYSSNETSLWYIFSQLRLVLDILAWELNTAPAIINGCRLKKGSWKIFFALYELLDIIYIWICFIRPPKKKSSAAPICVSAFIYLFNYQ